MYSIVRGIRFGCFNACKTVTFQGFNWPSTAMGEFVFGKFSLSKSGVSFVLMAVSSQRDLRPSRPAVPKRVIDGSQVCWLETDPEGDLPEGACGRWFVSRCGGIGLEGACLTLCFYPEEAAAAEGGLCPVVENGWNADRRLWPRYQRR